MTIKTIYESFDKQECIEQFNKAKPDFWCTYIRIDKETLKPIYVLEYYNIKLE